MKKRNKKAGGKTGQNRERLKGESIESRVLLSGTWIDPSTGDTIPDATTGDDVYQGTAGDDAPSSGGAGNDVMLGGAGNDTLGGGDDLDVLMGGAGNDVMHGDGGNDTLISGGGDDQMFGDGGDDVFRFTDAQNGDVITVDGGTETDTIDLTEFGSGTVTDDGSVITVDLGDSSSFTINYSNIENVITADTAGNHGPDADAGRGSSVPENTIVTLNGSNSSDFDGNALTYQWTQIGGPSVTISDASVAQPTFTSPTVGSETTLTFSIVVSDGTTSHVDTVEITVLPTTTGTAAGDSLTGTGGGDFLTGQGSNDILDGAGGDDVLQGGAGDDTLQGGTGTDIADYGDATSAVSVDITVTTAQNTGGGGTDTLTGIEGVTGSSYNDTFHFSNPQDGAVYIVDGNGGNNTVDLSGYASTAVTFGDGTMTVDMGGGQSFTIEHDRIDSIAFSDITATVLSGDLTQAGFSGTGLWIDGDEAFRVDMTGGGTIDLAYDTSSDTFSVTGATGVGISSSLSITDLNGTDLRVDQITLDEDFGDLITNVGVGSISILGQYHDINGTFTIGGDLGSIYAYELKGTLDVQGDAGTIHIGRDIVVGGTLTVSGDVTTLQIDDDIAGTVNITGNVTTFDLTGIEQGSGDIDVGASVTFGGDVGTMHIHRDVNAPVAIAGSVGTMTVDRDVNSDITIGGDLDSATVLTVGASATITATQVVGPLVFNVGATDHGGTYGSTTAFVFDGSVGSASTTPWIYGTAATDVLAGTAGDDFIDALAGDDSIAGGAGDDTMVGGAGSDTVDYSAASSSVTVDLTVTTAQNTGGAGVDTLVGIEGVIGSAHDDTFAFTDPANGAVYTVDGGGGSNTLDLANYNVADAIFADGKITIDTGNGFSFEIDYSNIETVQFGDVTATVLTGDTSSVGFSGEVTYIEGDAAFTVGHAGGGTLDWSYVAATNSLSISDTDLTSASSAITITSHDGSVFSIDSIASDGVTGSLTTNVDIDQITFTLDNSRIDNITVANGAGYIGSITYGGDMDWGGTVTIDANVGTFALGAAKDIDAGTFVVTGDLRTVDVPNFVAGTVIAERVVGQFDSVSGNPYSNDFATPTKVTLDGSTSTESAPNSAPIGADNTITLDQGSIITFTAADFGYDDADGDPFTQVQITSLEHAGSLELNGVPVTQGQVISKADIDAGNLKFVPAAGASGAGYDSFSFKVHDGAEYSLTEYSITVDMQAIAPTDLQTMTAGSGGGVSLNDDGGNDAYFVADTGIPAPLSSFTIEMQFEANSTPLETVFVSYNTASGDEMSIQMNDPGDELELDFGGTAIFSTAINYTAALLDGERHAFSVTWDNVAGDWEVFIDGVSVDSGTGLSVGETIQTGGTLVFGHEQDSEGGGFEVDQRFSGTFHDIRLFDTVRSSGDIVEFQNSDVPRDTENLVANWRFDALSADGVITEVVSGNNLTLQHVSGTGFTSSTPEVELAVDEYAADGTVVGTIVGTDAQREALIGTLLAGDSDLSYNAETGKFYKTVNTSVGWSAAQSAATGTSLNGVNGQLVTVDSAHENEIVTGLASGMGSNTWLGMSDADVEGEWRDYDGATADDQVWQGDDTGAAVDDSYTNWQSGQPGGGGSEDYARLDQTTGQWDDLDAAQTGSYIVEWSADDVLDNAGGAGEQPLVYSIVGQTIAGAFTVDADSGELTVADGSLLDYETNANHTVTLRVTDVDGNTYDEAFTISLNDVSGAVTANAGADQTVNENGGVTLDASGSVNPESPAVTYTWTQVSGTSVTLTGGGTATPTFTAPEGLVNSDLQFEVSVNDGTSVTTDTVTITVNADNDAPSANAGSNQTVTEGDSVGLNAGASTDPEGQGLTYTWTQVSGTSVTLTGGTSATPTFTAPEGLVNSDLQFEVSVSDGVNPPTVDTVTITVNADNDAPTASAGGDQTVTEGDAVSLDASGSSDPESQGLTYTWTQVSGTSVTLTGGNTSTPTFTAPEGLVNSDLQFEVSVSDGTNVTTDTVTITVNADNDAPTIIGLSNDFLAYSPGTGAQVIDQGAGVTVTDVDSTNFNGGSLTVDFTGGSDATEDALGIRNQGTGSGQIGVLGSDVTYEGTVIGSWSGGANGDPLLILLNASADETSTTALLQNITFQNSDAVLPTIGARTVSFVLTDGGGGTSAAAAANVYVGMTVRDDFSVQSYGNNAGTESWSGPWVESDSQGGGDADGRFRIAGGQVNVQVASSGDNLYREVDLTGATGATLTFNYNNSLGGSADLQVQVSDDGGTNYTTVAIFDASTNQGTGSKSIDISDDASSNTRVRWLVASGATGAGNNSFTFDDVQISYILNEAPTIENLGGDSLVYAEGDGAVVIEQGADAVAVDVDSTGFDTGTLTVSFQAGSDNAEDELAIRHQGTAGGEIGVSGNEVSFGGVTIGTFSGGSGGSPLVITFNASASPTAITALTQGITYENTDTDDPTTGARTVRYVLTDGEGATSGDYDTTVTVSGVDDSPVANAGQDQSVTESTLVTLDATGSGDPENQSLTYTWTQISGTSASLTGGNTATPTFTAPEGLVNSDLQFQVSVSDGVNPPTVDTVTITVNADNDAPTASAGGDQAVNEGDAVGLDASGSSDPENQGLTYTWSQVSGTSVTLTGGNTSTPTFTAPEGLVNSDLQFEVSVSDGTNVTTDTVTITVNADNDAPSASAGANQTVTEGDSVGLNAGASTDPEGQGLTYTWTQVSGTSVSLTGGTSATPSFTAPEGLVNSDLQFEVSVSDGTNVTTDTVTITVNADNDAPSASAGANQTVTEGDSVGLNAGASTDPEGQGLTYTWTQISGTSVTLTGGTSATPTFTAPEGLVNSDLQFEVSVSDGTNVTTDTVTITVNADNDAPSASAGANQTVTEGDSVGLNAGASTDPEGQGLTYTWTQISGTSVTLTGGTSATPTFTAPEGLENSDLQFEVSVSDGTNVTTDTVTITVNADNDGPSASAGANQTVTEGDSVGLDASGSIDPENQGLTYTWTQVSGTSVSLTGGTTATPTFTAPEGLVNSDLQFEVSVSDGVNPATTDTVTITVNADNDAPSANAGANQTVTEGASVGLNAGASTDPEGQGLTYTWTQVSGTSVSLTGGTSATPSFTAPEGLTNSDLQFEVSVSDGTNVTTDTVTITVNADNDAPSASAGANQTVTEGDSVGLNAGASTDPEGQGLTYTWTQVSGTSVSLTGGTSATPTFTAPEGLVNSDLQFEVSVSDGTNVTTDTVTITVNADNDAPSANAGTNQTVTEGASVGLDASGSVDPEDQVLTYTWTQVSGTSVSLTGGTSATPTFTAPEGLVNSDLEFEVSVSDGTNVTTDTVTITVNADNDAPSANAGSNQTVTEGDSVGLNAGASTDPEGQGLTYTWTQVSGTSVTLTGGTTATPTFTAPEGLVNSDLQFEVSVSDGTNVTTDTVTITVNADNDAPSANAGSNQTVTEGDAVGLDASASSDPEGVGLTYTWTQISGTSVSLTGGTTATPTFTAPEGLVNSDLQFEVSVSDGTNVTTDTVTITVNADNDAPSANAGSNQTVTEGDSVGLNAGASTDPEGQGLTYTWTQVSGTSVSLTGGTTATPTFTAPEGLVNSDLEFEVSVSDGTNVTTDTVTITVNADNDAPSANAGSNQTVTEGDSVGLNAGASTDPEGQGLTYTWTQVSGTSVSLTGGTTATPTFTAPEGLVNSDLEFEVSVSDGTNVTTDTVTITVNADNDAPSANAGSNQTVTEGDSVGLNAGASTDPEGQGLTYTWTQVSGTSVSLTGGTTATPTFTAPEGLENSDLEFQVSVSDGTNVTTDTVTITVNADNDAPSANAGSNQTVTEGDSVGLNAGGSTDPEGQGLTYTWTQISGTSVSLTGGTTATPTFTAPEGLENSDLQFEVSVSDGTNVTTDTVTITVNADNDAVSANAGANQTVAEGDSVGLDASGSIDPEGQELTYTWTQISGTSVSLTGGTTATPTFTAPEGLVNSDLEFEVSVSDGTNVTTDTVTITVNADNDAPSANAGSNQTVTEGDSVGLNAGASTDPEGQGLTYTWTQISGTSVSLTGGTTATPTFTAPEGLVNSDLQFEVSVSDGTNVTTDTVTITVNADNDAPSANAGSNQTVTEGDSVGLNAGGSTDPEGQGLTYTWTQISGTSVTLTGGTSATPTFTAPEGLVNSDLQFEVSVSDGTNVTTDTVTITVNADNDAPSANAGSNQTVTEGDAVGLNAGASTDPEGQGLTYTWTQISGTSVSLTGGTTATPTFTAPEGLENSDLQFEVSVSDGTNVTTDTVTITVNADNDAVSANAGANQTVAEGDSVGLDASGSIDPEGQELTYTWTQVSGTSVSLTGGTTATPTFTAPEGLVNSDLQFEVSVSDGTNVTTDTVTITVNADNDAPSANAGSNQTVTEGDAVGLNAGASTDPEGQGLTYTWTQISGTSVSLTGGTTATPTFTAPEGLVNSDLQFEVSVSDGTNVTTDTVTITVNADNDAPSANAGSNQTVTEGDAVGLNAGASTDPEGQGLTYTWTQISGTSVSLTGGTTATPTFTAPEGLENSDLQFEVSVSDGTNVTTDTVTITVNADNDAVSANAGANQTVAEGDSVGLDASGSIDPEGQELTYTWTQISGTSVSLTGGTTATPTFTAPEGLVNSDLEFEVSVSDGTNVTTDTVTITVNADNDAPSANAGSNQTVTEGDSVGLNAGASTDPEGQGLTYTWTQVSGTSVTLTGGTTATPTFTAPEGLVNSDLQFEVSVSDGTNVTTDTVTITVNADNDAVSANAGANQTVAEGDSVGLDASGSIDPEGQELTYTWTQISGTSVSLTGGTTATPTFTAPEGLVNSDLEFEVSVSDGTNVTTDTVTITVNADNDAPSANAGSNQTVTEGDSVGLNAGASTDPEGQGLTYTWTQISGTSVSLTGGTTATPTFTAPEGLVNSDLQFEVSVSDGTNVTTDTVTITVNADNDAPSANAGSNQTVTEGDSVGLNAGGSTDPEGQGLTYTWTQISGTSVTLTGGTSATPTFTAPEGLVNSDLQFEVSVSDGTNVTTDTVTITVNADDNAPSADAGSDQTVDEGDAVSLDASASTDPEGQGLTYTWTQVSGPSVTLTAGSTATPTFTAPEGVANTDLQFEVSISDGGNVTTDTVTITVNADNDAPAVNVTAPSEVDEGTLVRLDASGSSDPEGQGLSYTWTQIGGPSVVLSDVTSAQPSFTAQAHEVDYQLTFQVAVSDGATTSYETVSLVVHQVVEPSIAPTVDAGADQFVEAGQTGILISSAASSGEGALTYRWIQIAGPEVQLSGYDILVPTFTVPEGVAGTAVFQLEVTDGELVSADTVAIYIEDPVGAPAAAPDLAPEPAPSRAPVPAPGDSQLEPRSVDDPLLTGPFPPDENDAPAEFTDSASNAASSQYSSRLEEITRAEAEARSTDMESDDPNRLRVDAGLDLSVTSGEYVTIAGRSLAGGNEASYAWKQVGGPAVGLDDSGQLIAGFRAPTVEGIGKVVLTFELSATGTGGVATDRVEIEVLPESSKLDASQPLVPIFTAGQEVVLTAPVMDGPGDAPEYQWEQVRGTPVSLSAEDGGAPKFAAPDVFFPEVLEFRVSMTDGDHTATDYVKIRIDPVDVVAREDVGLDRWGEINRVVESDEEETVEKRGVGRIWAALLGMLSLKSRPGSGADSTRRR